MLEETNVAGATLLPLSVASVETEKFGAPVEREISGQEDEIEGDRGTS